MWKDNHSIDGCTILLKFLFLTHVEFSICPSTFNKNCHFSYIQLRSTWDDNVHPRRSNAEKYLFGIWIVSLVLNFNPYYLFLKLGGNILACVFYKYENFIFRKKNALRTMKYIPRRKPEEPWIWRPRRAQTNARKRDAQRSPRLQEGGKWES